MDPASISTGWALFKGRKLVQHGTVATPGAERNVFRRLDRIFWKYWELRAIIPYPDEVHIEQLVRRTHIYTHYSVGGIGTVFAGVSVVAGDIPISSWQRSVGWHQERTPLKKYVGQVDSEDELAAIGMGLYWIKERI